MTIIYQTTEDDADDTVVPRFNSAGGDGERLIFIKEDSKSLSFGEYRFIKMSATYEAEQKELTARVTVMQNFIDHAKEKSLNTEHFLLLVRKYTDIKELGAEIIR